eukprot:CAMPEP_0172306514 /NCGR_PEP_ID=MMETSP1058-20130122/7566_1 /TAXON_ID=83371 /ORGANISM="Detonula confervacea, Strain CCMP 353" /LENGTH=995 /DNA_ID=CAMNT_0013018427 /DNA_START=19 /DNA_END=3006 /DNA_ORIENTATION=+
MSASNDTADAASSWTANGVTDFLDDEVDAAAPPPTLGSPPSSPPSKSAAAIVSEAASLTPTPSSPPLHTTGTANDDDVSSMASSSPPPNTKPSIATVTAIVDEVLRQKESGASANIASIASKEVDKFYDDGRLEDEVNDDLPPPAARPPARSHPWNQKVEETKAFFGGKDNADQMERGMQSPPANEFQRNSAAAEVEIFDENNPSFNDLCEELGITPQTHPHLWSRSPYRRFNISPESLVRSTKFQYCMIVSCLVSIAMIITSAVTKGLQHAEKRDHELHPYYIKEEEAKKDKEWWVGDGIGNGVDENKEGIIEIEKKLTKEELEQLYYDTEDAYLPIWFDRSTGWTGTTYKEAMKFCKSHDDFVPCPYHVYCPGAEGLIFDEVMEEVGRSWSPIMNSWNQWVQVGKGGKQCTTHYGRPDWELTSEEDNEKITRHIMCCLEHPLGDDMATLQLPKPPDVEKEHGEGVDDPIPPPPLPPPPNVATGTKEDTTGPSFASQDSGSFTALDENIRENYRPFWFDNNDGWEGTTYAEGKAFCNSIPAGSDSTFHLCPIKAVCPNGHDAEKPLVYQMDPFGGGSQWAPISNNENAWAMVGKVSDQKPSTCMTFLEFYHHDPVWGTDGSQPDLKHHILCCEAETGYDGGIKKGDYIEEDEAASQTPIQGVPIVQITPTDIVASPQSSSQSSMPEALGTNEDGSHTGAGNSSPHAGEHNYDDHITALKKTLNPIWYSSENEIGWSGGSHDDALKFCDEMNQELCPQAVVCPNGPTFPAFESAWPTGIDESPQQWVATIDRPNQWVLIGTLGDNGSTQCMDYEQLNGNEPSWGLDGSMPGLKHHILCCKKTSHIPVQEGTDTLAQTPASQTSDEEADAKPTLIGTWFHAENGWNGGSHNDAAHFCALKEVNRKQMELCPYHVYCPQGPSRPSVDGQGIIGDGEESEQFAPTSNGDNQWVMVGMHGHNKATQCLTHGQLNGAAPDWGLDGSNKEKKHHIMCCTNE